MNIRRTNSSNKGFIKLITQLDAYLKITDGEEHAFYNQYNAIDKLHHVIVAYENEVAIGCGAIKKFNTTTAEIKRMYLSPDFRNKGIAQKIIKELELWAKELGYKKCILETGKRQVEAVKFYRKCGYNIIPNYGQYKKMENSICFETFLVSKEKNNEI